MVKLRGHHLLCRLGFRGHGYDERFIENMTLVVSELKRNPEAEISISDSPDILCENCPNHIDERCQSSGDTQAERRIREMDQKLVKTLGIEFNRVYSIEELDYRLAKFCPKDIFEDICKSCEWKSLGHCLEGLISKQQSNI